MDGCAEGCALVGSDASGALVIATGDCPVVGRADEVGAEVTVGE